MAVIEMPARESLVQLNAEETPEAIKEGSCIRLGFVAAEQTEILKHRVLESRGGYNIVEGRGQVWLEDSKGNVVSGPVKGTGAFIMYGKLKDLTGVGTQENPLQKNAASEGKVKKTERELAKEAEESLDAKIAGRRK